MNTRTWVRVITVISVACALALGIAFARPKPASAHCQIPCGIYDDAMRFAMLEEDITTVEKSMNQIVELSADPAKNANQLIRWVTNKDAHADKLAEVVTQYFLQQRIKPIEARTGPEWDKYADKLRLCHEMLVTAMKAKQTTDLQNVEKLRALVADFEKAYFTPEELQHFKEHQTK